MADHLQKPNQSLAVLQLGDRYEPGSESQEQETISPVVVAPLKVEAFSRRLS